MIYITKDEARGYSRPVRAACLSRLGNQGLRLLLAAARCARPSVALSAELGQEAWFATRERWGGLTVDLSAAQTVRRDSGWAVPTGGTRETGYHRSVSPAAGYGEFVSALAEVANYTPPGQYLGVFYDADENRIDIDTVYVTDNRDDAIAVGVAAHSTGGAYDFATGEALWMPHLIER
jgi:hypothetical protein